MTVESRTRKRLTYFKTTLRQCGEGEIPMAIFLAHHPESGLGAEVCSPPGPSRGGKEVSSPG